MLFLPSKIAVIGSINEDFIVHGKTVKHSYGGILYNLVGLATLLSRHKIYPFAYLGTNVLPKVRMLTRPLKNIKWTRIKKLPRKSNQANLFYTAHGKKKEILKHGVPGFTWNDLKPALKTNVILINFISGWEISPALFKRLRRSYENMIYIDLHSLLLGIRKNGQRFPRIPKNWDVFLDADDVQMNKQEWELVAGMAFNRRNLVKFCRRWEKKRWETITVTLAERGAILVCRPGPFYTLSVRAPRIKKAEPTGAGDFFAAGVIAESLNLESEDLLDVVKKGVGAASWKCKFQGIENVLQHRHELKRFLTTSKSQSKLGA